ncbi:MAG: phosphomannomutase/phosphoglucomutase [Clostridia bacterium]|nr:phosphomannomutase/phosphoglucomutase [Clostridia bacterium]
MMSVDWKTLKSGTDIRGVAVETEKGAVTLTDEVVESITAGFLLWLADYLSKPVSSLVIAVGHDSRISADRISAAVQRSAIRYGCKVFDCGLASTPSMFMITIDHPIDGSIQITASHHPFHLNGLKFFTRDGGLQGEDISKILSYCSELKTPSFAPDGTVTPMDYMPEYAAGLRQMIASGLHCNQEEKPLSGFHIVVDAGNGAGGFYAKEVLQPLGADITGSVYLEPDGLFPNHIPNPEAPTAMASIREAVLCSQADFGVIFDTDVDRGGCVDSNGTEINRNRLVALASAIALKGQSDGVVVTDSVTSDGLKKFIENHLGGHHYRYKRGYRNVINKALELCNQGQNALLAIETSGHAAFRDNYFLDDGAYLVTRIIIQLVQLRRLNQDLSDLFRCLDEPKEAKEIRYKILENDFKTYGTSVLTALESFVQTLPGFSIAPDNREGIRICADHDHGDGWLLLRLSVHDPVMPLNVESNQVGGCDRILSQITPLIDSFASLQR